jgi:hypothetical protein
MHTVKLPELARKWYAAAAAQEATVGDCEELQEAWLTAGSRPEARSARLPLSAGRAMPSAWGVG